MLSAGSEMLVGCCRSDRQSCLPGTSALREGLRAPGMGCGKRAPSSAPGIGAPTNQAGSRAQGQAGSGPWFARLGHLCHWKRWGRGSARAVVCAHSLTERTVPKCHRMKPPHLQQFKHKQDPGGQQSNWWDWKTTGCT